MILISDNKDYFFLLVMDLTLIKKGAQLFMQNLNEGKKLLLAKSAKVLYCQSYKWLRIIE